MFVPAGTSCRGLLYSQFKVVAICAKRDNAEQLALPGIITPHPYPKNSFFSLHTGGYPVVLIPQQSSFVSPMWQRFLADKWRFCAGYDPANACKALASVT